MEDRFLSPKRDIVFKLLFGDERNIDFLTDFLKSVLRLPEDEYDEVTVVDPNLLPEFASDKLSILDVKVKTKRGKTIDIEIQILPTPELRERIVCYAAKMITEQVGEGMAYSNIKRVISIIITDFTLITDNVRYHNRYTLYDPETNSEFSNIIEVNTLELTKLPENGDGTDLWAWMKFLSARNKEEMNVIAESSPQVKKAVARLAVLTDDERARMLIDNQMRMEGYIYGREQWVKKESKEEVAHEMLMDDVPIEKVIKYTGLLREDVERLRVID